MFFREKKAEGDNSQVDLPSGADGMHLDESDQDRLAKKRSQRELARAWSMVGLWCGAFFLMAIVAIFAVRGWMEANDRYMNNVRVAWIKMQPNGQSQVEYWDDGGAPNRFFQATVNASLINYVEHRYRKHRQTIVADYGYSLEFMGDDMRREFLDNRGFNAAKVASNFESDPNAGDVDAVLRAIDHNTLNTADAMNNSTGTFESAIYITLKTVSNGVPLPPQNKIVKIIWSLRPVDELTKQLDMLKVNPLGIKLISDKIIDDVIPISSSK